MITEALIDFFFAVLSLPFAVMPDWAPPSWVTDAGGVLGTVVEGGASLGAWIPWGTVGIVVAAIFTSIGVAFGIKVARIVASFLTLGGGSAA